MHTQFRYLGEEFRTQCGDAIQDFSYSRICKPDQLKHMRNLEIYTFHIPANENDKRAFEYAYSSHLLCVHCLFLTSLLIMLSNLYSQSQKQMASAYLRITHLATCSRWQF